jgi:hypothetical protein
MICNNETLKPISEPVPDEGCQAREGQNSWWESFRDSQTYLTSRAIEVLEIDARWIAEQIYFEPEEGQGLRVWPDSRIRTGIVVGSVQSGKTANMLAVSSMLLDKGVDIIVILCGTQISLWLQTYDRLLSQLDGTDTTNAYKRNSKRVIAPLPGDVLNNHGRLDPTQYFNGVKYSIKKALTKRLPIIVAIPKQTAHMQALKRCLRDCYTDKMFENRGVPLRLVVLDDEADDASVLDSKKEEKLTPWNIQDFWSHEVENIETIHKDLYACYVAYTATPQANFLQETHNPLAPRDFAGALRTPGPLGELTPRTISYTEPQGLSSYYTGGWAFYEILQGHKDSFCVASEFPERQQGESDRQYILRFYRHRTAIIGDALRSYLVAGALKLMCEGKKFSSIKWGELMPCDVIEPQLPSPHTMLLHPSGVVQDQFDGAKEIERWSLEKIHSNSSGLENDQVLPKISPAGLAERLMVEEPLWKNWFNSFVNTANELRDIPGAIFPYFDEGVSWEKVKCVLKEEVFPFVKIKVLNSDPRASDRPSFQPQRSTKNIDLFELPEDLLTIFVAGNVLSRGVTLEGLTTSVFLRAVQEPAADTQMQMQRWFGYRGKILPLCRVFLYQDQLELFQTYHDSDEATKSQIINSMEEAEPYANNILILHGEEYWATKKVTSSRLPLHPGPAPSVKIVEEDSPELAKLNLQILESAVQDGEWISLEAPQKTLRGRIRKEPLSILEVADILDRFSYSHHQPTLDSPPYERWEALRQQLGSEGPFFSEPLHNSTNRLGTQPKSCPYTIAAYFRLWHRLATHPNHKGFSPTNSPQSRWHFAPSQYHKLNIPKFYIGIRFGDLSDCPIVSPFSIPCMRRSLKKNGVLKTLWGTRGRERTYLGDEYFDYHLHSIQPLPQLHSGDRWRPRGHPGLLLFHAIKNNNGIDFLTVGLSIPHGGPDHIAAIRGA